MPSSTMPAKPFDKKNKLTAARQAAAKPRASSPGKDTGNPAWFEEAKADLRILCKKGIPSPQERRTFFANWATRCVSKEQLELFTERAGLWVHEIFGTQKIASLLKAGRR